MQQLQDQDRREKLFRSNNPGQIARQAVNSVRGSLQTSSWTRALCLDRERVRRRVRALVSEI